MNLLNACISWKKEKFPAQFTTESFKNEILDLFVERIPGYAFCNKKVYYNGKSENVTAMIGYISNLDKVCTAYGIDKSDDVEVIEKLYSLVKTKFFGELEGVFTIFIWDGKHSGGYFFQDDFGSNIPVYYTLNNSLLCISTSLKEILRKNLNTRELNQSAVQDYMIARTMVPNKHTFIKGIYKLIPNNYIKIYGAKGTLQIRKIRYPKDKITPQTAKNNLMEVVKDSILDLLALLRPQQRTCTLSSGYDSNIVLLYMTRVAQSVRAITIGGKRRDEIPNASKVAEQYDNVKHEKVYVNENKLEVFPDIVWRTEGYTCESGLIMQYEISSLMKSWGLNELISGEGADHVMDRHRLKFHKYHVKHDFKLYIPYILKKELWPQKFRESRLFKYARKPSLIINYDIELDYILKKSGTISNSFDVQLFYPLLNRTLREYGSVLGKLNASKNYYKQELSKIFGESKMAYIAKAGGATDVEYLFKGYENMVSNLLNHDLIKTALHRKRIEQVKKDPMKHTELVVRLLNLFVFNQLFISGKYDKYLQDTAFNMNLKDLVKDDLGL